mgnify:CR=1 FL=1
MSSDEIKIQSSSRLEKLNKLKKNCTMLINMYDTIPESDIDELENLIENIIQGTNTTLTKETIDCLFLGWYMKNIETNPNV